MKSSQQTPATDVSSAPARSWYSHLKALDAKFESSSEFLNPILVKEARQAMKSRQFLVTFTILLVAGWLWSIVGVVSMMPSIYLEPYGASMLIGYYIILVIPVLVVVPFSAYRSLAAEREDGTYELLAITTLCARQIVTGKLGSAILQIIVYYSALAPCIAFTYLLRGIDVVTMFLLLGNTFMLSIFLSGFALMCAGLSRSRRWQVTISVVLLLCLVCVDLFWVTFVIVALFEFRLPVDTLAFWGSLAAIWCAAATYLALFIAVATSQNTFASDNRSTNIRILLVVQMVVFVGWTTMGWLVFQDWSMVSAAMFYASIHWVLYATVLIGESGQLSPRVRRKLPVSFFGRVFLTWFNPGSGSGYVFAVCNMTGLVLLMSLAEFLRAEFQIPGIARPVGLEGSRIALGLFILAYFIFYLGVSRLVILMLPIVKRLGMVGSVLIHALLLFLGAFLPVLIEFAYQGFNSIPYSALQTTNWYYTLGRIVDSELYDSDVLLYVWCLALIVLMINLVLVVREVETTRVVDPQRVQVEDIQAAESEARTDHS